MMSWKTAITDLLAAERLGSYRGSEMMSWKNSNHRLTRCREIGWFMQGVRNDELKKQQSQTYILQRDWMVHAGVRNDELEKQ